MADYHVLPRPDGRWRRVRYSGGLRDAEDDDRAVVFEWLAPAVGHCVEDGHGGSGGGWGLHGGDGAADSVDPEASAVFGSSLRDPVGYEDEPLV